MPLTLNGMDSDGVGDALDRRHTGLIIGVKIERQGEIGDGLAGAFVEKSNLAYPVNAHDRYM